MKGKNIIGPLFLLNQQNMYFFHLEHLVHPLGFVLFSDYEGSVKKKQENRLKIKGLNKLTNKMKLNNNKN